MHYFQIIGEGFNEKDDKCPDNEQWFYGGCVNPCEISDCNNDEEICVFSQKLSNKPRCVSREITTIDIKQERKLTRITCIKEVFFICLTP